jgi:hypothetical protein
MSNPKCSKLIDCNANLLAKPLFIHGRKNQIFIDSRRLAVEFGRPHKSVLRTIDALIADQTISRHEFVPREYMVRGKKYRYIDLNEKGFLIAMPFIGGSKSKAGQKRLVEELYRVHAEMNRLMQDKTKLTYQVAKSLGKDSRMILTDVIKDFIAYAKQNGSQNADRYYGLITESAYEALFLLDSKFDHVRELLSQVQLSLLSTVELMQADVLATGIEDGKYYKDIYKEMKSMLNAFVCSRTQILGF